MHLLPARDLIAEYQWYASRYLDDDQPVAIWGMCEMRLVRLGEILYQPLSIRLQAARADLRIAKFEARTPHSAQCC